MANFSCFQITKMDLTTTWTQLTPSWYKIIIHHPRKMKPINYIAIFSVIESTVQNELNPEDVVCNSARNRSFNHVFINLSIKYILFHELHPFCKILKQQLNWVNETFYRISSFGTWFFSIFRSVVNNFILF